MRTLEPEDFENAIAVMQRLGWCKGQAIGPGGAVCAARALNIAAKERSGDWADLHAATKVLAGLIPFTGHVSVISRWNDLPSTRFLDIQDKYLSAARKMRAQSEGSGAQDLPARMVNRT